MGSSANVPPPPPGGRGVLCVILGKGVPRGLWNPYPMPDHVQLILQSCTRLDTGNPYPTQYLLFLELYNC